MICESCGSDRVLSAQGKCSDLTSFSIGSIQKNGGYVPSDMNIGGGDYIEFDLCLECGQIDGHWPCPETDLEREEDDEEEW
jgi:hypothetical protein